MKNIVILGSTGSIGRNTLDVIDHLGPEYRVHSLAAKSSVDLLIEQALRFKPRKVAILNSHDRKAVSQRLRDPSVEVLTDEEALVSLASDPEADIVVNALVGAIGLRATLKALSAGKIVALANKESIVMAGHLVMEAVANSDGLLIPIDSEHSAILQCLRGEIPDEIKTLILTASGGPFLRRPESSFAAITTEEALQHPNWQMGPKITVDSATLMNKGLEVIEAHYLFDLPPEQIKILVHPESVVHSLVEFVDGSIKAQLSLPDMRIPIQYALTYPERLPASFVATDLTKIATLHFEEPDYQRFPCLNLAFQALKSGNGYPTVLNAANEMAVTAFLANQLAFIQISGFIQEALNEIAPPATLDLAGILNVDRWTRTWCRDKLNQTQRIQ
ncbi:MAG: 1-deoxy-D-xylulose-5-phosphate reductoisomerase [bacterium]|nr:1-deoxy-D-xylulose-5-phosphate reductoisomerase [bacterium]